MKRFFLTLLAVIALQSIYAQVQFGYLSYSAVLHEMPEYAQAQSNLTALRAKYNQEAERGEDEFQKKFVDFLQGQKDFPTTILQKRQAELQNLMDNGLEFRNKVQKLMKDAEKEMVGEVEKKLNNAILAVGVELGYAFVMNIDNNNYPFINPVLGVDVTIPVKKKLGLPVPEEPVPQAEIAPTEIPIAKPEVAPVEVVPVQQNTETPVENVPEEH